MDWKHLYGSSSGLQSASILVIATRQQVFLVDMAAFGPRFSTGQWQAFVEDVFSNEKLLKLVYNQDLDVLQRAIPGCVDLREK